VLDSHATHRALHSFPTRRSSDLGGKSGSRRAFACRPIVRNKTRGDHGKREPSRSTHNHRFHLCPGEASAPKRARRKREVISTGRLLPPGGKQEICRRASTGYAS